MSEGIIRGTFNRVLQILARISPGARTLRVKLNRLRGVKIGSGVWIGYDSIIETSHPELVTIKDGATIGIRSTIIAHFLELRGVVIEEEATIGPGAMIMPNVTVGRGAVVTAGSVVTQSVPPFTVVQGNPAKPIARCGIALTLKVTLHQFTKSLRPLR